MCLVVEKKDVFDSKKRDVFDCKEEGCVWL